jgi:hypothetical protein
MTKYIILRKQPSTETELWEPIGGVLASSPRRAIAAQIQEAGEYVAVPVRSWHPLTAKVETTTKTTIE